ncbi:winged helix-turn-helix transcriptional regulator [Rhodococcus sp. KRD197]|uniref:winged helix-turn-helix transcriptional regulator n=1 Tax=unclassified Rhodococcus (in: high G+C Gram-positive bacteria) TaxID=192944 RepID=UPI0027DA95E0|nr:response regulator transcription factor [Rhodococcus sp. KRD197]
MRIGSSDELPNPGPHVALHTLLLTEHEPAVAKPLIDDAAARGIDVHWYHDGAAALLAVGAELPTLVVLAAKTAAVSSEIVVAAIRARSTIPILVGAFASDSTNERRALAAGATAVVKRPYDIATIAAFAGLSSPADAPDFVLAAGPLRVDRLAHAVWLHGRELALSHREFELLAYLLEQNGRIVGQEMISQAVWGHSTETNTVAVHVKRLREKLGTDPHHGQIIRTIRGLGYGLAPSLYQPEVPIQP